MGISVVITQDYDAMSKEAARILLDEIIDATKKRNKQFNLGVATGGSPKGLYDILVGRKGEFDQRLLTLTALDEYIGLPGSTPEERRKHPESYHRYIKERLADRLPMITNWAVPDGAGIDVDSLQQALYDDRTKTSGRVQFPGGNKAQAIVAGPRCLDQRLLTIQKHFVDAYIQRIKDIGMIHTWVMGIGEEGHIAFHESGIPFDHDMFVVKLAQNTIDNAVEDGSFEGIETAPVYALTMGAQGILNYAENVILLANGKRKTKAIGEALLGEVTPECPASMLQRFGRTTSDAIIIVDEIAAKDLLDNKAELNKRKIKLYEDKLPY